MTKSGRQIMEILKAYDLTGCAHSAAQLAGTDRKTVLRYVTLRAAGAEPADRRRRPRAVDELGAKVEELVDRSSGKIRADVVHRRLTAMGYTGSERSTGGRSPRRKQRGGPGTVAPTGRGFRSRRCGCSGPPTASPGPAPNHPKRVIQARRARLRRSCG